MNKNVIIIGGGIVGCLSALEFKKKGFNVTIIEKSKIGHESSSAAAGILYPLMPWKYDVELYELSLDAPYFYEELSKKLLKDFHEDIEFIRSGLMILPPYNEDEILEWAKKNQINLLKKNNAILIPSVTQINPRKLMSSIKVLLMSKGIKIYENTEVTGIKRNENSIDEIFTSDKRKLKGDIYILSAGAWSSIIYKKLIKKIKPIRGQIIQYPPSNIKLENILYHDEMYILQRKNKTIIAGSTIDDVGFSTKDIDKKVFELHKKAKKILPELNKINIEKSWHGFRPGVDDNKPIILQDKELDNLYIHSGHFRYGITMAPATTKMLVRLFN